MNKLFRFLIVIFLFLQNLSASSEIIKNIVIQGNDRISDETVRMFIDLDNLEIINDNTTNRILKDLYDSNFFENVSVKYDDNVLLISLKELPIIQNIFIEGIKAKKFKDDIKKNLILKSRSSYNEYILNEEKKIILNQLKNFGYYFSEVSTFVEKLDNNMVNVTHKVDLGEKAKIKKISFIGDKIFKDKELKNVIISEEYKFWKFLQIKNT